MELNENLFEEANVERKHYTRKPLSKPKLYDQVIDKIQQQIIRRKYKVGTDGENLTVNKKLYKTKNKDGNIITKSKFMTDESEYKDLTDYLDNIGVEYLFKKGTEGLKLILNINLDNVDKINLDNAKKKPQSDPDADLLERKADRIKEYRKWAQLKDDEPITEDMIDDWAFKRTCRICNCSEDKLMGDLKESMLLEDEETLGAAAKADIAQAKSEIDNEVVAKSKSQIESVLDRALRFNKMQNRIGQKNFQNVLLIGEAGTGKSSIVRQWAKDNGVNLFEVRAAGMDDTDLGGAISKGEGDYSNVMIRLASTEFDDLNRPNSVLFLDEYNRAPKSVRTNLLELVNSHIVPDPRTASKQRYLPNFLFTVAAINPANPDYDTDEMDMAEKTRFKNVDVVGEPLVQLNWIRKELQKQIDAAEDDQERLEAEGKLKLAETLLKSKYFEFDNRADIEKTKEEGNGIALNYRTFTMAIMGCDGTKEDFLAGWNSYTNNLKKPMVERILRDYKDIDDKANQALSGTDSEVFKDKNSLWDRIEQEYLKD